MKKYIQEATDKNVWDSLKNNTFNRAKDIQEFIEGLELIEGNAYISLDAKWGDGKTFFVKQIGETLKYFRAKMMETEERPLKNLESYEYLKESEAVKLTSVEHLYLPVYYNAWMYDDYSDPLMSLLLVMTKQCGGTYNTKINMKSLSDKLVSVASSLPLSIKKINPAQIVRGIQESNMDILSAVKTGEEMKGCVRSIFNDIIVEETEKLVIFIDELDRCKPSFAIEMLERIKHYFDDERIIFVVSLNKEQLIHTISNYYGDEFDSTRYLNRFFDVSINLPELDEYDKRRVQCTEGRNYWIAMIADDLSDYYNFSLRDKLIYKSRIESAQERLSGREYDSGRFLALFVPVFISLEMTDAREKKRFLEGKSDICEKVIPNLESGKEFILKFLTNRNTTEDDVQFTEGCKLLKECYSFAFGSSSHKRYFDKFNLDRDFRALCIKISNGAKI